MIIEQSVPEHIHYLVSEGFDTLPVLVKCLRRRKLVRGGSNVEAQILLLHLLKLMKKQGRMAMRRQRWSVVTPFSHA